MVYRIKKIIKRIRSVCLIVIEIIWRPDFKEGRGCYITCSGKVDGVGAQVQAILSTMLLAQEFQLTYVHTPFKKIAHGKNLEVKWERFFNLGKDEIIYDDIDNFFLRVIHITHPNEISRKANRLYVIQHAHGFADSDPNCYENIADKFLEKYNGSSKKHYKLSGNTGKVNIAVHVRRGDVSRGDVQRYTDTLFYKNLLSGVASILNDAGIEASIHLYSQGELSDFFDLEEVDINYHLNECVFTTFYNLTEADILIMSKSSFSYSAALLSKSIKIYQPFWHKPLDDWIVAHWSGENEKVDFNESSLKKKVYSLLTKT